MTDSIAELKATTLKRIDEIFDPLINSVSLFIDRLEEAGQDPSNYYDVEENEFIDYVAVLKERQAAKQTAVERVLNEFERLNAAKAEPAAALAADPNETEIPQEQGGIEAFLAAVVEIVRSVLEDGVRIKIGPFRWDSEKPLVGFDAAFSGIRDEVMKAIGVDANSDLGKILRDPTGVLQDVSGNVTREVERTLDKVGREAEKALDNATREATKLLDETRRHVDRAATSIVRGIDDAATGLVQNADKAATNVVREVSKVLPKIKLKKPKLKF